MVKKKKKERSIYNLISDRFVLKVSYITVRNKFLCGGNKWDFYFQNQTAALYWVVHAVMYILIRKKVMQVFL